MPLQPPPRDAAGSVTPHDHEGIQANDGIIRRVSDQQIVTDAKSGGRRLSSMAFKASTGANAGMSVDLQKQIEEAGLDARTYVTTPRWTGSLRFEAREFAGEDLRTRHSPSAPHRNDGGREDREPMTERLQVSAAG